MPSVVAAAVSLEVWPRLNGRLSQGDVINLTPKGVFRMAEFPRHGWSERRLLEGLSFTAVEVV